MEVKKNGYFISTHKDFLNKELIHNFLSNDSYWANDIPIDFVERSIEGSICFGVYKGEPNKNDFEQVGFARVITDEVTFAYLADVFIIPKYRKQGLSKWMMDEIMRYEKLSTIRTFLLGTKDAHTLYSKYGFEVIDNSNNRFMGIFKSNMYKKMK